MTKNEKPFEGYQVRITLVRETADSTLPARYITSPRDVANLMRELGDKDKDREHFAVIVLDTKNVLESHSEAELTQAFVVVEPGGYRIRKLP